MRPVKPGDVLRMKSFEHDTGNARMTFKVNPPRTPKKNKAVALFMLLGTEPAEAAAGQLDVFKRLGDLGWTPTTKLVESAVKLVDEWLDTPMMKLRAGEMTAQESRTVKAVLSALRKSIQELDPDHGQPETESSSQVSG